MEVLSSKIHSINESVCPGAGHLSSFFLPGGGALPLFSCPTPGNCQLKGKKSANARGGWAMLELTDALRQRRHSLHTNCYI